jgi:hypothetical protein
VTDKPRKKGGGGPPNAPVPPQEIEREGTDAAEEENERPTLTPPFDVEAFARAATTPSGAPRPSSDAPANRSAHSPAVAEFEAEASPSQRDTLTNELELEKARARSAISDSPKRTITSSVLSIANARAPSSPNVPKVEAEQGPPRKLSPSSIEAAVLGAIGGSAPPEITERTIEDPVAEMRERFSLGDYTGALEMSELILADWPDHPEALEVGENSRRVLENMFAARLGPLDRVPMVIVPRGQMRWLSMDHRAGFVLSLIDGSSSVDMILDMCGMPKLDALRILHELVQQKVVSFR